MRKYPKKLSKKSKRAAWKAPAEWIRFIGITKFRKPNKFAGQSFGAASPVRHIDPKTGEIVE